MRGLLMGCVLVTVVGCGKAPDHYDLAKKLKSKGIEVEVKQDRHVATFTERTTGLILVVAVFESESEARKEFEKFDFARKNGGVFVSGRYIVAAPRDEDGDLLVRARKVLK